MLPSADGASNSGGGGGGGGVGNAGGKGGSGLVVLKYQVAAVSPATLTINATVGQAITPTTFVLYGVGATPINQYCTSSPGTYVGTTYELVPGIVLDENTCVLSGTPTAAQPTASFVIGGGGAGSVPAGGRATVSITVTDATPPTPPAPIPPSAPTGASGVAGDKSIIATWSAPSSEGSYPVSMYQVTTIPSGGSCLVSAPTTSCVLTGLTNGTAYTFTVAALSGAGWGPAAQGGPVTPGGVTPAPQPQPLPTVLEPGESLLQVNGKPVADVTVDPKPTDKGLTITGPDFAMDLDGLDGQGKPLNLGPDGVLVLNQERNVQTSGRGFLANSDVDLYVDPPVAASGAVARAGVQQATYVGTVRTTAAGTFEGLATLPDSIKTGDHVLQAVGTTPQGGTRAMSLGVQVVPSLVLDKGTRTSDGRHDRIRATGSSTGIDAGVKLTPYIRYAGQSAFSTGKASIVVEADGTFAWTRQIKKGRALTAYVSYTDTKSNEVVWLKVK
jgi:hypothetical protein